MPLNTLKFNGESKPWLYLLEGRSKSPFAPVRNNLLRVQGMPGAYIESTDTDVLYITQPVGFLINNDEEAMRIKDELASWLLTDEPAPLEFSDESGRTYYAKIEGTIEDLTRLSKQRKGTLTFLCADPYSYGEEKGPLPFVDDALTITNEGTAKAKPIIELETLHPTTFAMVQKNNEEYIMIGEPYNVDNQDPYIEYEKILTDECNTLTGWTTANAGEIDGLISGNMESVNDRFQAATYGTGSGWHGPAIKKSLSEVLQDFRMTTWVSMDNSGVSVGRIELYLLDVNGNIISKVAMKDVSSGAELGYGEIRIGNATDNHNLISEYGDRKGVWNNFAGMLQIERRGNFWNAFIGVGNSRQGYHSRRFANWYDTENKYMTPVAQVVVHMGQYGSMNPIVGGIYSIGIDKINPQPTDGIPYIVNVGDVIEFNHVENKVLINGELQKSIKDFGARYFKLSPGENTLTVFPKNNFNTTVRYQEPYS